MRDIVKNNGVKEIGAEEMFAARAEAAWRFIRYLRGDTDGLIDKGGWISQGLEVL